MAEDHVAAVQLGIYKGTWKALTAVWDAFLARVNSADRIEGLEIEASKDWSKSVRIVWGPIRLRLRFTTDLERGFLLVQAERNEGDELDALYLGAHPFDADGFCTLGEATLSLSSSDRPVSVVLLELMGTYAPDAMPWSLSGLLPDELEDLVKHTPGA
jgi:hypothetical protein